MLSSISSTTESGYTKLDGGLFRTGSGSWDNALMLLIRLYDHLIFS